MSAGKLAIKQALLNVRAAIAKAISAFFLAQVSLPLSKGLTLLFMYLKFRGITP
jgi:hypothetical protein